MFKKDHIPWNKGKTTGIVPKTAFKKGHVAPKTAFAKGLIPWNKGLHTGIKPWLGKKIPKHMVDALVNSHKGIPVWNKGIEWQEMQNEKHPSWKGNDVGYMALHSWINRKLGKASKCINGHNAKIYYWANISGEYKRDLSDWHELCPSCNRKDGIHINERFGVI